MFSFDNEGDNGDRSGMDTLSGTFDTSIRRPFLRRTLRSVSGVARSSLRRFLRTGIEASLA